MQEEEEILDIFMDILFIYFYSKAFERAEKLVAGKQLSNLSN